MVNKVEVGNIYICTATKSLVRVDFIDGINYKASVKPIEGDNWYQHTGFFYIPFLDRAIYTNEYIIYSKAAEILFTK